MKNPKILILIGGSEKPLQPFSAAARKLGVDLATASFADLEFNTSKNKELSIKGQKLTDFALIYLRVVGKRFEDAALVVQYARKKGLKLVDHIFEKEAFVRLPLAKSLEARLLTEAKLPLPPTYFGTLKMIAQKGPLLLGWPLVIKGTTGKQGHAVWSPRNSKEMDQLLTKLRPKEKSGGRFIAQKFIQASQRHRLLVVGNQVVGAITRPTRWRQRFTRKAALRTAFKPIPVLEKKLALKACQVLGIDIAGVDIICEDATKKLFILEVNSAPAWHAIKKDTGVVVEEEVVRLLVKKAERNLISRP